MTSKEKGTLSVNTNHVSKTNSVGSSNSNQFYDLNETLSYNGIFNFVFGARSSGKSYAAKEKVIKAWKNYKTEFVYLRRYEDEMLKTKDKYFDDIEQHFDVEIKCFGDKFYIRNAQPKHLEEDEKEKFELFGYAIALSQAQRHKSSAFPYVKYVIFEEFILENGNTRYLPNEMESLMSIYSTIDRGVHGTKLIAVSNTAALNNPFFIGYDLKYTEIMNAKKGVIKKNKGAVIFHLINNHNKASDDKIQLLAPKEYAEYATNNVWADYSNAKELSTKPDHFDYRFTLTDTKQYLSAYFSSKERMWYFDTKKRSSIFNINPKLITEYVTFPTERKKAFVKLHNNSKLYFSSEKAKYTFLDFINP